MKLHIYIYLALLVAFVMFSIFVNVECTYQETQLEQCRKVIKQQQIQLDSLSMEVKKLDDASVHIHYVYPYEVY